VDPELEYDEKLVKRAKGASKDERNERLLWLYTMNEYLGTRGTNAEVETAMKKFGMAQWDSSPSKRDFAKMFHIAIGSLRKSVETKLIQPLEKTLDKEEENRIRLKKEAASMKRKSTRKANDE
jgi:hypothetical protein